MPLGLLLGLSEQIACTKKILVAMIVAIIIFLKLINLLAALGLHCCAQALSSCGMRGLLFVAVCGLLIAVASLVAEHGL